MDNDLIERSEAVATQLRDFENEGITASDRYHLRVDSAEIIDALLAALRESEQNPELFYLQDSRSYVGNDVLWWRSGGGGYTTNLREAGIFTKDEAYAKHRSRVSDIPWSKAYIDTKSRPTVDMQYIKKADRLAALKGAEHD